MNCFHTILERVTNITLGYRLVNAATMTEDSLMMNYDAETGDLIANGTTPLQMLGLKSNSASGDATALSESIPLAVLKKKKRRISFMGNPKIRKTHRRGILGVICRGIPGVG